MRSARFFAISFFTVRGENRIYHQGIISSVASRYSQQCRTTDSKHQTSSYYPKVVTSTVHYDGIYQPAGIGIGIISRQDARAPAYCFAFDMGPSSTHCITHKDAECKLGSEDSVQVMPTHNNAQCKRRTRGSTACTKNGECVSGGLETTPP